MSINIVSSPITNFYAKYDNNAATRASTAVTVVSHAGGGDSPVSISNAARQALGVEQAVHASGAGVQEVPEGMALLQIPSWLGDFGFNVAPSDPEFAQRYPQAAAAPRAVLDEFGTKIFERLGAVVAANGVSGDLASFHQKMIVDKQSSEQIREQFVTGIRQDPSMMSVMEQLGLTSMLDASDAHAAAGR